MVFQSSAAQNHCLVITKEVQPCALGRVTLTLQSSLEYLLKVRLGASVAPILIQNFVKMQTSKAESSLLLYEVLEILRNKQVVTGKGKGAD